MPTPPTREPRVTHSTTAAAAAAPPAGQEPDSAADTSVYHDTMTLPTPSPEPVSVASGVVFRAPYFDLYKCTFTNTSRGTPLQSWIKMLERAQRLDEWDVSTAVRRSMAHISGPALPAVDNLLDAHPELYESWEDFKAALLDHFQPEATDWDIVQQIANIRQTSTVAAYNAKVTHLRSVMPRTLFGHSTEPALFVHYISNLRPAVRSHVLMTRPTSLDKAMRVATVHAQVYRDGRLPSLDDRPACYKAAANLHGLVEYTDITYSFLEMALENRLPSNLRLRLPRVGSTSHQFNTWFHAFLRLDNYSSRGQSGQSVERRSTGSSCSGNKSSESCAIPSDVPREFDKLFELPALGVLPPRRLFDLKIDLIDGATVSYAAEYNLPKKHEAAMREFIETNLAKGYIRLSRVQSGAPFRFEQNDDGTLRPVINYGKLNAISVKHDARIPVIDRDVHTFAHGNVYSVIELADTYSQLRIRSGDEEKAAFWTPLGIFEPIVVQFGLKNAAAAFQAFVNDIFSELCGRFVHVYMDKILVYSPTRELHRHHLTRVGLVLRKHSLRLNKESCKFFQDEVDYLGIRLKPGRYAISPEKIAKLNALAQPQNLRELRQVMGFFNYLRGHIPLFAALAAPLAALNRANTKWKWGVRQRSAFNGLVSHFRSAKPLRPYGNRLPTTIVMHASDDDIDVMGAVLLQWHDSSWHAVAFWSKQLSKRELNYSAVEKGLFAIIQAVEHWEHLLGSSHFVIWTDDQHYAAQHGSGRQRHWHQYLNKFAHEIVYRADAKYDIVAAMSRPLDLPFHF